jgi:hypothetical protein
MHSALESCAGRSPNVAEVWDVDREALPRCFILNEQHHVILVCSPRPGDPLNAHFMPNAYGNKLPGPVDQAIRALEEACERDEIESKSARIGDLLVQVKPLRGPWGQHTTVVVDRSSSAA